MLGLALGHPLGQGEHQGRPRLVVAQVGVRQAEHELRVPHEVRCFKIFFVGAKNFIQCLTNGVVAAAPGGVAAPLPGEVHDLVPEVRLLVPHHRARRLVHDLHLAEVAEEVSVEVHVELAVIVEGEPQPSLLVAADLPPLLVAATRDS